MFLILSAQAREWDKLPSAMRVLMPALSQIGLPPSQRAPAALPEPPEAVPMPDWFRRQMREALRMPDETATDGGGEDGAVSGEPAL